MMTRRLWIILALRRVPWLRQILWLEDRWVRIPGSPQGYWAIDLRLFGRWRVGGLT